MNPRDDQRTAESRGLTLAAAIALTLHGSSVVASQLSRLLDATVSDTARDVVLVFGGAVTASLAGVFLFLAAHRRPLRIRKPCIVGLVGVATPLVLWLVPAMTAFTYSEFSASAIVAWLSFSFYLHCAGITALVLLVVLLIRPHSSTSG